MDFCFLVKNLGRNVGKNVSKNLRCKYNQKRLDRAKQFAIDGLKNASKRVIEKKKMQLGFDLLAVR